MMPNLSFLYLWILVGLFACQSEGDRSGVSTEDHHPSGADTVLAGKYVEQAKALLEMAHFDKALVLAKKAEAIFLEKPGTAKDAQPSYLEACKTMGYAYREMGEYDLSLKSYLKALSLASNIWQASDVKLAQIYNNVGSIYYSMGKDSSALEYYNKSKKILTNTFSDDHPDVAMLDDNIGGVYMAKGEFSKAISFQKKGMESRLKSPVVDSVKLAESCASLLLSYVGIDSHALALKFGNLALSIRLSKFGKVHPEVGKICFLMGEIYLQTGRYALADSILGKSLVAFGFKGVDSLHLVAHLPMLIYVLDTKARVQRAWYDKEKDVSKLKKSRQIYLDAMEVLRWQAQKISPDSKPFMAKQAHDIYGEALVTSYQLYQLTDSFHYKKECFYFSEYAKSFSLYEAIRTSKALAFSDIPTALIRQENDFGKEITRHEKLLQTKLTSGLNSLDTSIANLLTRLSDLNRDYGQLKKKLKREYPKYYEATQDMPAISLEQTQTLLAPNQALLEYFIGDYSIFIFAIRPDSIQVLSVKKDFSLKTWVAAMRAGLIAPHTRDGNMSEREGVATYATAAHDIYTKILQPVQGFLDGRNLIVVPDGELGYVPFDALLSTMPDDLEKVRLFPYLLKKHPISISYSATLLREMRQKRHENPPSKHFLGVAPDFPGIQTNSKGSKSSPIPTKKQPSLTKNKAEVEQIKAIFGGDLLVGDNATEQHFSAVAGQYRVLHLSTHAKANDQTGDYSYLAFYESDDGTENELLFNRELYNLRLNADLVVLSACETGIGELQRGEGVISLARGFSYAGAKSIVTTLWKVKEQATLELMQRFYENLKKGMEKDEALRSAKVGLMDDTPHVNPFLWAAFVPVGDMTPVVSSKGCPWVWPLGLAGLVVLIGLLRRLLKRKV